MHRYLQGQAHFKMGFGERRVNAIDSPSLRFALPSWPGLEVMN